MEDYAPLFIFIGLFIIIWLIKTYNDFIKYRNMIEEQWSGVDVALRRRFNLIPNLINTVKGYGKHESETLLKVTDQRTGSGNLAAIMEEESEISRSLNNILAVAENYPDLKANHSSLDLQQALNDIEQEIQQARRTYNAAVRKFNTQVQSFPSNYMAGIFNFRNADYFSLELATQRELPKVDFS